MLEAFNKLNELVQQAVKEVENQNKDLPSIDGTAKKVLAIKMIDELYDQLDEKYKFPEIMDSLVKNYLVSFLVDLTVDFFNKLNWN